MHSVSHASRGPSTSCRDPAASLCSCHWVADYRGRVGAERKEGSIGPHLWCVLGLPAAPHWLRGPPWCPHWSLRPGCQPCPLQYGRRWNLVNGEICLRKESPKYRQEFAGRLLAAALNVSPERQFTTLRTLISAKDLVILENLTPKLLPKPGPFCPDVGWRSKLFPEHGTLSSQANPDSFTALEIL